MVRDIGRRDEDPATGEIVTETFWPASGFVPEDQNWPATRELDDQKLHNIRQVITDTIEGEI